MKTPDRDRQRFRQLMAGALEGQLDDVERQALNQMLAASAEARRDYRGMMELHARLHLEYTGGREAGFMPGVRPSLLEVRSRRTRWPMWLAAAATIALLAALFWPGRSETSHFATLQTSVSARWGGGDLPTREGSRLGQGTLKLEDGFAVLRFDSGAEISLEAPVELQLVDAMNCRIIQGTAVTHVPESAAGFRVDTPSALVTDYGTRFAVSVDPDSGDTRTQVFEGLVDVQNPISGDKVSLKTGQRASVQGRQTGPVVEGFDERFHSNAADSLPARQGSLQIEASKDAYVGFRLDTDSTQLLYVKHGQNGFHRKAYLGFNLTDLNPARIASAVLDLQFEPTGLGFASQVPDATFSVYGLVKDQPWDETKLWHHNAPANIMDTGAGLVSDQVRKLGSFVVLQGVQRGRFGIEGETLVDYLREHAGSSITLIIVRETAETNQLGLVHGIASHRHPVLPPPTLAIRLRDK